MWLDDLGIFQILNSKFCKFMGFIYLFLDCGEYQGTIVWIFYRLAIGKYAKYWLTYFFSIHWCPFLFLYSGKTKFYRFQETYSFNSLQIRVIKMSSPKVNNIIIIGSISCYISIILCGMDTHMMSKEKARIICGVRK